MGLRRSGGRAGGASGPTAGGRVFLGKLWSVECVSISLKFRGYFAKLTFTKFGDFFFCKIAIHGLRVDSLKFENFFL